MVKIREKLNVILSSHTGQPIEKIRRDTERDFFMSPEEAQEYGLIDRVLYPKEERKGDSREDAEV
jgi:ATP-dependent Clp protease protease subunit